MAEFQVGDKVVFGGDPAEVVYGAHFPAYTDAYTRVIVRLPSGKERTVPVTELTHRPAFKVGDEALLGERQDRIKILAGPFKEGTGGTWYAARFPEGDDDVAMESSMSPLPSPAPLKVGDRIQIILPGHPLYGAGVRTVSRVGLVDGEAFATDPHDYWFRYDDEGTGWERVTEDTDTDPFALAEDTTTLDGATYVMGAKYQDQNEDVWVLGTAGGVARGSIGGTPTVYSPTLLSIVDRWGPLTMVRATPRGYEPAKVV